MKLQVILNGDWGKIKCGGRNVCCRPNWDWHSGCMGSGLYIMGKWVDFGDRWTANRPVGVAKMIEQYLKEQGKQVDLTIEHTDKKLKP